MTEEPKGLVDKTCPDCGGDGRDCKTCDTSGVVKTVATGYEPIVPDVGKRPRKPRVKKVNPNAKPCSKQGCKVTDARHYVVSHLLNGMAQAAWSCGRHLNDCLKTLNKTENIKFVEVIKREKVVEEVKAPAPIAKLNEFHEEASP